MKKIIFILVWIIAGITVATAQISSYSFEYTAGTYSEITGGTVVYSDAGLTEPLRLENYAFAQGRTLISEPANVTGFPIGFSFIFGSQTFTHFAVSPNGFIYLGGATPFLVDAREVSSDINVGLGLGTKNPILSDRERFEEGAINVLGFSRVTSSGTDDISATTVDANTEISYLLSGTAGDRVLTIQFKQIILSYSPTVQDPVDIQIRLYEANSKVEMIFNNFNIGSDRVWAEIGLKGDVLGNTKYLTTSASSNWSTATAGVTGNVNLFNAVCANGTTFAFTPPPFCVEPASQATALEIAVASNSISGSFTAAEADEYLVLIGKDISLTGSADRPADNTTYVAGQEIGKFTVVARSSATTFEAKGLEGSSKYTIHIYALNSNCLNGPKYRRANPLIADVTTLPGAPVLSLAEGGFTSLKLATEANQANNPVIIAQNTGQYAVDNNNNQLNDGAFGMPTAGVNVGDLLEGGGTVIYKGAVSNAIEVNGLNPGELVNFAAWSYDANENAVSSLFAKLNITTWGTLPYVPNFSQYAPYAIPEGWEEEGGIFQLTMNNSNRRGDFLQGRVTTASPVNPASGSVATQYLQLAPGNSRLILSGKLEHTTPRPFVTSGYTEWEDNDSMVFSAKKVGDTDYTTVYTIDKANAGDFFKNAGSGAFSDIAIPIEGFGGAIAKVKMAWTTHKAGTLIFDMTKFVIEEKPDHEPPVNLSVDPASVVGHQARVSWEKHAEGIEEAWEVRYRIAGTETWSTPEETNEASYLFTTLPTDVMVEVQVRAVAGLNKYSPWTLPPLSFKTGYGLPYSEDFEGYTNLNFAANSGWTLGSNLILWNQSSLRFRVSQNPAPAEITGLLPKFDFGDGSVNYKMEFDLFITGAMPANNEIQVILQTEEGDVVLGTYQNLGTAAERKTINLVGYTGIQQLGFKAIENTRNTTAMFVLDNLNIDPSCPVAVSDTQAAEVNAEDAKVTWDGDAAEWLVFIRKKGETTKNYETVASKEKVFTGLEIATAYEVGITTACAPNDLAPVTIVSFVTLSTIPCDPVSDVEATSTTGSATITWTSDAARFNVKFRPVGGEEWVERSVNEATVTFNGLEHNTDYEYTIQAVCSEAEGDESEWTAVATIKTVEITCFAPVNIIADPLDYRSATLGWEGDASKYELLWAKTGEEWATEIVNGHSFDISGLTPVTAYQARVRSICAEGDTSAYSPVYNFTTAAIPACPVPTNLSASSITSNSALLTWTSTGANSSWSLRHRPGTVQEWVEVPGLETTSYELTGLEENTAYLWRVKALCAETENESAYASQETFTTKHVGLASIESALQVAVSKYMLSILNPEGIYIDNIRLYGTDGSLLQDFSIRSSDNVLIPMSVAQKTVIVKVTGSDSQATFKALVK